MAQIVPPGPAVSDLMTTAEVAQMIRQSTRTVRRHSAEGRLTPIKLGPCTTLYERADVERLIASSKNDAAGANRGVGHDSGAGIARRDGC